MDETYESNESDNAEALAELRRLAREEGQGVPWWKGTSPEDAEQGDWVGGTVTAVQEVESENGNFKVYVLDDSVGVSCSRTALAQKFEEKGIAVGDLVSVEYLGKKTSPTSGRTYHNYAVGVNKAGA